MDDMIGTNINLWSSILKGAGGGETPWTPAALFAASEEGAWYDPSDFATLWQDTAGTTPVTATGQAVARMDDKSGNGNHLTQATAAARPTIEVDGSGNYYLDFDGVDDNLAADTASYTASGDVYVVVAADIRAVGGGATAWTLLGCSTPASTGSFVLGVRNDVVTRLLVQMRVGTGTFYATPNMDDGYTRGVPFVAEAYHESEVLYAWSNEGTTQSIAATDDGVSGTARQLNIAVTTLPVNWYGGVYLDRVATSDDKTTTRAWLANKAGVTL